MLAAEVAADCLDQHWVHGSAPQAAGFPQREHPLHSAIPLGIVGALHDLAPEDGKPQRPLRPAGPSRGDSHHPLAGRF
jgi:hypothetical protein